MPDAGEPALSLSEWLVLCLICEGPTHGNAIAGLLARGGGLGQVWRVHKAVIYRAMERLEPLSLVRTAGEQRSTQGPVRSLVEATPAGQAAASAWLSRPVAHARDIRSELLVKLALLDRAGADSRELLRAQQELLAPIVAALADRLQVATGFDRTVALWRHETITATLRFLDALQLQKLQSP
jgi:DNA-binding PadR family transcriptional regulator